MEKISLLLDEDVQLALGAILRKRGFDTIHTQELSRKGKSDYEQLEFAINNDRTFFTYNIKDFVLLHNEYINAKKDHCGIILSKQLSISETLKRILIILQKNSKESIKNKLIFI